MPATVLSDEVVASHDLEVLVIDDHPVFADLLALALNARGGTRRVAVANTVSDGLAKAATCRVDVAIVDVQMPDEGGLSAIGRLRELNPRCRVMLLTAYPRRDLAERAIREGAVAFLTKSGSLEEVMTAMSTATDERPMITRDLHDDPTTRLGITPRECEVLGGMVDGLDAARIATAMGLSVFTVRDHIKSVLGKLGSRSQIDAVSRAISLGFEPSRSP